MPTLEYLHITEKIQSETEITNNAQKNTANDKKPQSILKLGDGNLQPNLVKIYQQLLDSIDHKNITPF